jgi:hypothetical protein
LFVISNDMPPHYPNFVNCVCFTPAVWRLQVEWLTDYERTGVLQRQRWANMLYGACFELSGEWFGSRRARQGTSGHSIRTHGKIRDISKWF